MFVPDAYVIILSLELRQSKWQKIRVEQNVSVGKDFSNNLVWPIITEEKMFKF